MDFIPKFFIWGHSHNVCMSVLNWPHILLHLPSSDLPILIKWGPVMYVRCRIFSCTSRSRAGMANVLREETASCQSSSSKAMPSFDHRFLRAWRGSFMLFMIFLNKLVILFFRAGGDLVLDLLEGRILVGWCLFEFESIMRGALVCT